MMCAYKPINNIKLSQKKVEYVNFLLVNQV